MWIQFGSNLTSEYENAISKVITSFCVCAAPEKKNSLKGNCYDFVVLPVRYAFSCFSPLKWNILVESSKIQVTFLKFEYYYINQSMELDTESRSRLDQRSFLRRVYWATS